MIQGLGTNKGVELKIERVASQDQYSGAHELLIIIMNNNETITTSHCNYGKGSLWM